MNLCSDGHDEIEYEETTCPVCQALSGFVATHPSAAPHTLAQQYRETLMCRSCGKPFEITRTFKNINADIRYCNRCKG